MGKGQIRLLGELLGGDAPVSCFPPTSLTVPKQNATLVGSVFIGVSSGC
jgi:hypothetical protein